MTSDGTPFDPMAPVTTHVDSFNQYFINLASIPSEAAAPFLKAMSDMAGLAEAAFGKTLVPGDLMMGPVREGMVVQHELAQNLSALNQLFADANTGIAAIADAAQVVGNSYEQTDLISSLYFNSTGDDLLQSPATVDDVDWAFGDPGQPAPAGAPSWLIAPASATASTAAAMSAAGDPTLASSTKVYSSDPAHFFEVLTFPDGSRLAITRGMDATITTAYDQHGAMIRTDSQDTHYTESGQRTVTTSRMIGDRTQGSRVTTVAVLNPDGSETISTTTDLWGRGVTLPDGRTAATEDHPASATTTVTIEPATGPPQPGGSAGPVQSVENQYGGNTGTYLPDPADPGY